MRVIVRVRPAGKTEIIHTSCDSNVGNWLHVDKPEPTDEKFSTVLGMKCTQHECYIACGPPMIASALKGRNSLLFAYGQSGAGKTFSMYGAEGGKNPSKLDGVVPATIAELFRQTTAIEKEKVGSVKYALGASLVEVQNKWIFDLLQDAEENGNQPAIRALGPHLIGNKIERIYSSRSLTHTIERGMRTRATSPNIMHKHSSRSHCILMLLLERREVNLFATKEEKDTGRDLIDSSMCSFYMVDLAGSEAFNYETEEKHHVHHRGINAGLLALGRVIMAMSDRQEHVPYRDSVITQLLLGALGGDKPCLTEMLCCLSPSSAHAADTKCSISYAKRCALLEGENAVDELDETEAEAAADKEGEAVAKEKQQGHPANSPMANDEFDEDEEANRRCELIEIKAGGVFARTSGDPTNPLVLYLHDGSNSSSNSATWNPLVTAFSLAKRESFKLLKAAKDAQKASKAGNASKSKKGAEGAKASSSSAAAAAAQAAAVAASAQGAEDDAEDVEFDDRFAVLRGKLSKALQRRQKEIMQTLCSLCQSLLLDPTRLTRCRHVLCRLCVERSIFYHRECPVCATPCGPPETDAEHDAVMRLRMRRTFRNEPVMSTVWKARLEEQQLDRRTSMRVVLEYGSILASDSKRTKATMFVGVLKDARGTPVHRGEDCVQTHGATIAQLIHCVSCDYHPSSDEDTLMMLNEPNNTSDERFGYTFTRPMSAGSTCHMTVHWASEIGVAPLEIRHKLGRVPVGRFTRRIVVQFPTELPVLREGAATTTPTSFAERRSKELSGWVHYTDAATAKAVGASARVLVGAWSGGSKACGDLILTSGNIKEARMAITSAESNRAAVEYVGMIGEANLALCLAASEGLPLKSATAKADAIAPLKRARKKAILERKKASDAVAQAGVTEGNSPKGLRSGGSASPGRHSSAISPSRGAISPTRGAISPGRGQPASPGRPRPPSSPTQQPSPSFMNGSSGIAIETPLSMAAAPTESCAPGGVAGGIPGGIAGGIGGGGAFRQQTSMSCPSSRSPRSEPPQASSRKPRRPISARGSSASPSSSRGMYSARTYVPRPIMPGSNGSRSARRQRSPRRAESPLGGCSGSGAAGGDGSRSGGGFGSSNGGYNGGASSSPSGRSSADKGAHAARRASYDKDESSDSEDMGASLLLKSASSASDATFALLYDKMLALIGPSAPPYARAGFLDELNMAGHGCDEPAEFFHVAIDLPGFGNTKASMQTLKRGADEKRVADEGAVMSPDFIVEVIKSLGKHYAYCIVASAECSASVFSALLERPNLASFLVLKEPQVKDYDALHSIFQPTLILSESRQAAPTEKIEQALMNNSIIEFSKKSNPSYIVKDASKDILAWMKGRKWRGHLSGFGHSKMRPLLTRLVGGVRMWSGVREYKPIADATPAATKDKEGAGGAKVEHDPKARRAESPPRESDTKEDIN